MSARVSVALALGAAAVAGCGSDDAPAVDAGGGGEGPFSSPQAFDRSGCEGGLDAVDPRGIWHLALDFGVAGGASAVPGAMAHREGGNVVAGVLRVDGGEGEALEAALFGAAADDVTHSASDLFVRHAFVREGVGEVIRAFNACAAIDEGALFGRYATCIGDRCSLATFEAYPIEPLDEPATSGLREIGAYGGSESAPWPVDSRAGMITVNVRVEQEVAYMARYFDGLRIADLSDPARPLALGHAPVADPDREFYNDVKVIRASDRVYAIAASNVRGAVAIDVTDPFEPREVATFPAPTESGARVDVHTLFVEGSIAYLANISRRGLDVYDVSDPRDPEHLGSYVDPGVSGGRDFVHDLYVEDGRVYLNYWNLGLVVVDVSDPADPERLGVFDDYQPRTSHSNWVTDAGGRRVSVHGDEGFGAHVRIVDVGEGSGEFMEAIASYQTRPEVSVHNIMAVGELAYVTYYQDGLRVLDLSDPADPQLVAHAHTWPGPEPGYGEAFFEGAIGVDVDTARDLIYVADTHRGLIIFEPIF